MYDCFSHDHLRFAFTCTSSISRLKFYLDNYNAQRGGYGVQWSSRQIGLDERNWGITPAGRYMYLRSIMGTVSHGEAMVSKYVWTLLDSGEWMSN